MKYFWERRVGVHSLEKLGAKMGANSFYYQRVRAERNSKNLGALNTLLDYPNMHTVVPDASKIGGTIKITSKCYTNSYGR